MLRWQMYLKSFLMEDNDQLVMHNHYILVGIGSDHIKFNTLKPRQNGQHDNFFKCIFLNENNCVLVHISLKVVTCT